MRITVMSDSHGLFGATQKVMEAQPDSDIYIHLGDGKAECRLLRQEYPDKNLVFVRGNCDFDCDFDSDFPDFTVIPVNDKHRIFACHGHKYTVKYTHSDLLAAARANHCNIVLYGHTHERYNSYEQDIHILNPGSCAFPRDGQPPSYAIIDIVGDGVLKNIISL